MTKHYLAITAIVAFGAAALLQSCAKEELSDSATSDYGLKHEMTFRAEFMTPQADKAHMDVTSHKVLWDDGDQIRINNAVLTASDINGTTAQFAGSVSPNTTYTSGMDVYRTVFPKTLASSIPNGSSAISVTLPESQKLLANQTDINNYMAAIASVTSGENLARLEFKNICAIIKVGLKADPNATTNDNTIRQVVFTAPGKNLSGAASLTFNNGIPVLTMASVSGERADVHMDLTNNGQGGITLSSTYTYFYVMVPAETYSTFKMKVINVEGKAMQKEVTGQSFLRSKVYTSELTMKVDEGYDPYEFELCDGTRFQFAPGNLQYQASTNTWRFAEHSWDIIGGGYYDAANNYLGTKSANNTTETEGRLSQSGWIDLFGWGTSGWDAGNTSTYGPCYKPTDWKARFAISGTQYQYTDYGSQYGPQGVQDLTGSYKNSDWGEYNAIYNPKTGQTDPAGTWRTPTGDEWRCIINIENSRTAFAQIDGTSYTDENGKRQQFSGLIIVPKGFIDPKPNGKVFKSIWERNPKYALFADLKYTQAELQVLINAGAAFLPAAGSRCDKYISGRGTQLLVEAVPLPGHHSIVGLYWSSTAHSATEAESMRFENQEDANNQYMPLTNPTQSDDRAAFRVKPDTRRCFGEAVRLIKILQ